MTSPHILAVLALGLSSGGFAFAASNPAVTAPMSKNKANSSASWMYERWTANEKPYLLARRDIERYVNAKKDPLAIASKYEKLAQKSPQNSLFVFRWGLATYYAAQSKPLTWTPPTIDKLLNRLNLAPSPRSAQFARMRFLVESRFTADKKLKTIGLRLLKHDPKDDDVKASMFPVLDFIGNSQERQLVLRYCEELVAKHPHDARMYAMLGAAYYNVSAFSQRRSDYQKSINAYQQYLNLAGPDDYFRERAKYFIKMLHKFMLEPSAK